MKTTILAFGILLCSISAFAVTMPMAPRQGKFSFNGDSRITNKVRSIYVGAQTQNIDALIKRYIGEGYTCEVLENDDYQCGRNESVTNDDMVFVAKANVATMGSWLSFAAPTEPPVLENANGDATIWTVTQDVTLSNGSVIPEMQYSFAGSKWKDISFFDSATKEQNDFQIVSETRLAKDLSFEQDDADGTHLEVTVTCAFDSER